MRVQTIDCELNAGLVKPTNADEPGIYLPATQAGAFGMALKTMLYQEKIEKDVMPVVIASLQDLERLLIAPYNHHMEKIREGN